MTASYRRVGITLIELLAVVSAVALLAGVLTPALADAGRRGKGTVCLQNLGRIAQASIVYAGEDADGQAIPVHPQLSWPHIDENAKRLIGEYAFGGKSGRGRDYGSTFFWGTAEYRGPAWRSLNSILYGDVFPDYADNPGPGDVNWESDEQLDLAVYRCPTDTGYTGLHYFSWRESGLSSFDFYGTSYVANALWGTSYPTKGYGVVLRRLSDIVNPAETLYYLENCGKFAYLSDPPGLPGHECGEAAPGIVHGWHGQKWRFKASFVDGHVDTVRIKGFENPDLGHYPSEDHDHWECVIVRGRGWQMDTLPLPPVPMSGSRGDSRSGPERNSTSQVEAPSIIAADIG